MELNSTVATEERNRWYKSEWDILETLVFCVHLYSTGPRHTSIVLCQRNRPGHVILCLQYQVKRHSSPMTNPRQLKWRPRPTLAKSTSNPVLVPTAAIKFPQPLNEDIGHRARPVWQRWGGFERMRHIIGQTATRTHRHEDSGVNSSVSAIPQSRLRS